MDNRTIHYVKELIACILTFGLFFILKDGGITKYVILLGVSLALFLYGFRNFNKDFLIFLIPSAVYIFIGLVLSTITGGLSYQAVKETAFAVIPFMAAVSFFMSSKKAKVDFIRWQYWVMIAFTLSWARYYYVEDVFETQYAFIFGVFLLYFCIIKKDIKYIIVTTFMLYLMNKRIAMLAAVLILVLYDFILRMTDKKTEWKKIIPNYLGIISSLFFVGYVVLLCTINLKGQFIQDLTSGRSVAWGAVREQYNLSVLWFGRGLGDVVNLLGKLQIPNFTTNLHNDLLKVFFEIGTIGYILWVISHFEVCYWISKRKKLGFKKTLFIYLVFIYTLLNYTTDNIMVYVNYWFPAYLILFTVVFSDNTEDCHEEVYEKKDQRLLLSVILVFGICILGNIVQVYAEYKNPSKFTVPHDAIEVCSPDGGSVKVCVWLREGQPYYRVRKSRKNLIEPSILGVETSEYSFEKNVIFEDVIYQEVMEEDASNDRDHPLQGAYRSALINMQKDGFEVVMELRVYDFGAAFRYILPEAAQQLNDLTQIRFLEGSTVDVYDEEKSQDITGLSTEKLEKTVYRLPFKVSYANGSVIQISEICEDDQEASYVTKAAWKKRTLDIEFYSEENAKLTEELKTPWRVFEICR